jgi:hypothetical protein
MPFYRSISGVAIVWLAATEGATTNREYLMANGVKVDRVLSAEEAGVTRIRGTPTLILLDVDGVVRNAWLGALGPKEEEQVRTALTGLSRF